MSKVKFIHMRAWQFVGMLPRMSPTGGLTIAYQPAGEGGEKTKFAFARCNHADRYVKKEGRALAEARLSNAVEMDMTVQEFAQLAYNAPTQLPVIGKLFA